MGGKALTIAVVFHAILLVIAAIWVFQIKYPPEKTVDFLPGNGKAGGSERGPEYKLQQKKQAQIPPTSNVKRVFAEGAISSYAIPDPGDSFGEMSKLPSLGGGGMSGGLGGSGGGKGFGQGTGAGLGNGLQPMKMFGLTMENSQKIAVVIDVSRSMTKYLPIVAKELDRLSSRGPLIMYFGCGVDKPPAKERLEERARPASGPSFDRFWQLWQGKTALNLTADQRDQLKYDPNAPMPLPELHKQMAKRLDTYFIDFNGIRYAQTALLCDELKDADTIYWFSDFMDKTDEGEMKKVLSKLKYRRQKLYMHATVKGKFFEQVRDNLVLPSGGTVVVKDVK
ncbi:MAG: hypothetical protein CFE26_11230 [Verrucomicrobiales bacterium VVV1]|nr:MAG: hypothetical protein CFE26_11230 [Verrucomicrobiales bacterium VVV1]